MKTIIIPGYESLQGCEGTEEGHRYRCSPNDKGLFFYPLNVTKAVTGGHFLHAARPTPPLLRSLHKVTKA